MTQTRPRGEQLRFESAKTGSHILDDYLEAVERGGRTLPDLLDDLFHPLTGAFRSDLFQFREDPDNPGFIQFRVGDYVDPNTGWITLSYTDFADLVASTTDAKDDAEAAAALAQRWASDPEDSVVSSGLYSSRHYSLKSASSASASASARDVSITARDESIAARNASQDARDASIGARDAAITAKDTALLAQGAAENARDTAISVTSSMTGGTTGQVLIKNSATDYDYAWAGPFANGDMLKSVYDPNNHETDAFARANHTGEQAISTVTGLQAALDNLGDDISDVASDLTSGLAAKQSTSQKGVANGYAGLDSSGKVPTSQLPAAVLGNVAYQGTWNAATNSPTMPTAGAGNKGHYYVVTTEGATNVGGITDWKVGDWVISNGATWDKVDNTDRVVSVAGKQGVVTLTKSDVGLSNVDNTSDANKPISTAVANALAAAPVAPRTTASGIGVDFDTLIAPGWHDNLVYGTSPNGWGSADYGYLLVLDYQTSSKTQLVFPYYGGKMRYRDRFEGAWSPWKTVAVHGDYLEKTQNLNDLPNKAAARTSLGATSVGAAVFTAASGAAAWSAMGAAGSIAGSGYVKLPSGLIMQWGVYYPGSGVSDFTVTYPVSFPNQALCVVATPNTFANIDVTYSTVIGSINAAAFAVQNRYAHNSLGVGPSDELPIFYVAMGY